MYPILYQFTNPGFLPGPEIITVYSYGFCIALGIVFSIIYLAVVGKKELGYNFATTVVYNYSIILAAVIGGKVFFWFENPSYYFSNLSHLTEGFSNGFVFYGSLIFVLPVMYLLSRIYKTPFARVLDVFAILGPIIHAFGRMGCLMAGCCYGLPTNLPWGITFTDVHCKAHPLGVQLHPTQLYCIILLVGIVVALSIIKRWKQFHGQLFLLYLTFYSAGRVIIEIFRGDSGRGYIVDNVISYAQFTALVILIIVFFLYRYLLKKQKVAKASTFTI